MKRHRSHQIDQLAQQILHDALPSTWVINEQFKDYAKDYLVEIGEDNGTLTGSSFYIQLKGQEHADFSADGLLVSFSLLSKYAKYYLDQITDLPVFLVVVDVNKKIGWWLFLQPVLEENQKWRKQDSVTIRLSTSNVITNTTEFRTAVDDAKKWLRLHHPASIHESVIAHKQRIVRIDPRFDVKVSLVNDKPWFTLLAKEEVPFKFKFTGDKDEIGPKVSELFDKGVAVTFQPGEVRIAGSKLFDGIEQVGCELQFKVDFSGTLALVCHDANGTELARLGDVHGRFIGGQKELWFDGELANSPFTVKLGPIGEGVDGSVKLNMGFTRWDGQHLMQLAYFDRLNQFFRLLPESSSSSIECCRDGNTIFSTPTLPLQDLSFARPLAHYLDAINKARKVCQRFNVNPIWTVKGFDRDTQETAEQLEAIYSGKEWSKPKPYLKVTTTCVRETFNSDVLKKADSPGVVGLHSKSCTFSLLGEKIETSEIEHNFTDMRLKLDTSQRTSKRRKNRNSKRSKQRILSDTLTVVFEGTKNTKMSICLAKKDAS